ncbi:MAG: hypothetical protein WBD45_11775 [Terriglobales bacterium]
MTHSILPSHDSPSQPPAPSESTHADYLMLDLSDTVLEARRMSASEARDVNLELEVEEVPYRWVPLSSMGD